MHTAVLALGIVLAVASFAVSFVGMTLFAFGGLHPGEATGIGYLATLVALFVGSAICGAARG